MTDFAGKLAVLLCAAGVLFVIAWLTILPTIGLFYVCGWLR